MLLGFLVHQIKDKLQQILLQVCLNYFLLPTMYLLYSFITIFTYWKIVKIHTWRWNDRNVKVLIKLFNLLLFQINSNFTVRPSAWPLMVAFPLIYSNLHQKINIWKWHLLIKQIKSIFHYSRSRNKRSRRDWASV